MAANVNLSSMKCPKCGLAPEINYRHRPVTSSASMRCPYDCFKAFVSYHSDSEDQVREKLIAKWKILISVDK